MRPKLIKGANVYFSRYTLECVEPVEPVFQRDTKDTAYLYYQNGFVCVTPAGIEFLPYDKLQGHIWREQIIQRKFRPIPGFDQMQALDFCFGRFLWNVAAQNEDRFKALCSGIGYSLHGFKNRSEARAICFVDEAMSDVPSGRAGKSIVTGAVAQVVPTLRLDAKNFRFDSNFTFQGVTLGTRVLDFNDAPKHFPFERLFGLITDDMQVERKNRDQFTLGFDDSPKIMLSTNYVMEGEGGSHTDRIFEIEFSEHYNASHKPVDDFGHLFFYDWGREEWNLFDHIMLMCLRFYLINGLYGYEHVNLEEKKLRQMTSAEFAEFALDKGAGLCPDVEYDRKVTYQKFLNECRDPEVTQTLFSRWLRTFAQLMGYEMHERKSGGDRFFRYTTVK